VAGYRTATPSLVLLIATIALLWIPPFVYAYRVNSALKAAATEQDAGASYLRMQRAASLITAESHYEPLKLQSEIGRLDPIDKFTVTVVQDVAKLAVQPIEVFAPTNVRGVLLSLLKTDIPACGQNLSTKSKTETITSVRDDYSNRSERAQTDEERELVRRDRASHLDRTEADFDGYLRQFRECLDKAVQATKLGKEEVVRGFKFAQRNAYLVYYAHRSFGPNSADYIQYISDQQFAAPELWPFSFGDITVLATICWLSFFASVCYLGAEYADSSSIASAARNVILFIMLLFLVLPIVGLASPISRPSNPLSLDILASSLHWPSLTLLPAAALAILGTVWPASTSKSRFALLAVFLCLPLAIEIEVLNAINTLAAVDYRSGNCPRVSWAIADRFHCAGYALWQPFVKDWGLWLANWLHWGQFWVDAGSRITISAILSTLIAWPISLAILAGLKREYVRPRDK
jgi:hypothetical protein